MFVNFWIGFGCACALAGVHFLAKIERLNRLMKRSWVLSGAGGIAVAYVFVHILPELSQHQSTLEGSKKPWLKFLENDAYVAALIGLVLYYGMERAVKTSGRKHRAAHIESRVFWIHTGAFAVYNGLIGYLLDHRLQQKNALNLVVFTFAMGLHFFVNDHTLHEHHREKYDRFGRWLLAGSVLSGWGAGIAADIPKSALALIFAFLSGAILVNVMKEELPHQKESSVWAFFLGAALYTCMLYFVDR
jgi:zinc transporter ZupT